MSSFFGRTMILLLVVDLNLLAHSSSPDYFHDTKDNMRRQNEVVNVHVARSVAPIDYDKVTDTEYEVISMEKKTFRLISKVDVSPYQASSVTKFQPFIAVLCQYVGLNQDNSSINNSHLRVYEDRQPFNLLFVINTDDISLPYHLAWNNKSKSLFIICNSTGIWQISWGDHLVRKYSCNSEVTPAAMSFSNDGNVLIIGREDNRLYACDMNGTLIRNISSVRIIVYRLHTAFGEYSSPFGYYDPRMNDRNGIDRVNLRPGKMNDFNLVSRTEKTEYKTTSTNIKRIWIFILRRIPEKSNDFDFFNLTIERRSKIAKHVAAKYNASNERLFDEFLSNRGDRFSYGFKCNNDSAEEWCFAPSASDDPRAAIMREKYGESPDDAVLSFWLISYYYDSDKHQLIAGLSNYYSDNHQLCILLENSGQ